MEIFLLPGIDRFLSQVGGHVLNATGGGRHVLYWRHEVAEIVQHSLSGSLLYSLSLSFV
jgi:hypothetical protein